MPSSFRSAPATARGTANRQKAPGRSSGSLLWPCQEGRVERLALDTAGIPRGGVHLRRRISRDNRLLTKVLDSSKNLEPRDVLPRQYEGGCPFWTASPPIPLREFTLTMTGSPQWQSRRLPSRTANPAAGSPFVPGTIETGANGGNGTGRSVPECEANQMEVPSNRPMRRSMTP